MKRIISRRGYGETHAREDNFLKQTPPLCKPLARDRNEIRQFLNRLVEGLDPTRLTSDIKGLAFTANPFSFEIV
jgi:hypothetical protein